MSDRSAVAARHARVCLGMPPERFESALVVHASPAWRGVEGDVWIATGVDGSVVVKHYHPETAFYIHVPSATQAAEIAGRLGVAPLVLSSAAEDGIVVFEELAGWRAGGLHDMASPTIRSNTIRVKKALHRGPPFPREGSITDDIRHLSATARKHRAVLPRHIEFYLQFAEQFAAKIAACGRDLVPCHRDGNTANLMIGPGGAVKLIDFDLAANSDPYEDVGAYLIEAFEREPQARQGFEEWNGAFDEGLYQRAMLYGILDHLRWGLIASTMAILSPRKSLEFAKYASWRFLGLQTHLQTSVAGDRLQLMK